MQNFNFTEHTKELLQDSKASKLAYTCEEFGKAANLSMPIVYQLIHADGFPALRVGKKWLIPCRAAEAWLEANIGRQTLSD